MALRLLATMSWLNGEFLGVRSPIDARDVPRPDPIRILDRKQVLPLPGTENAYSRSQSCDSLGLALREARRLSRKWGCTYVVAGGAARWRYWVAPALECGDYPRRWSESVA
jgi:hypothetical protein